MQVPAALLDLQSRSTLCTFCTRTSTSRNIEVASDENQSSHQKSLGLDVSHISVVLNFAHAIIIIVDRVCI